MSILCKLGFHKWVKIVKNKWRYKLGNYKSVDYHACHRCFLVRETYDKLAFLNEKIMKIQLGENI